MIINLFLIFYADNTSLEENEESRHLTRVKTSEICDKATATRILNGMLGIKTGQLFLSFFR